MARGRMLVSPKCPRGNPRGSFQEVGTLGGVALRAEPAWVGLVTSWKSPREPPSPSGSWAHLRVPLWAGGRAWDCEDQLFISRPGCAVSASRTDSGMEGQGQVGGYGIEDS